MRSAAALAGLSAPVLAGYSVWILARGDMGPTRRFLGRVALEIRLALPAGTSSASGLWRTRPWSRLVGRDLAQVLMATALSLLVCASINVWVGLAVGLGCLFWQRRGSKAKWRTELLADLPGGLEQLSSLLASGFSLRLAMLEVAEERQGPLAELFSMIWDTVAVGEPLQAALCKVDRRVKSADVSLFCAALLINYRAGGGLAAAMKRTAEALQERRKLADDLRVETTQARLSAGIVGVLPLAVVGFLWLFSPAFLEPLISTRAGNMVLVAAASANLAGLLIIKAIMANALGSHG